MHLAVRQHRRVRFVFRTRSNPDLHQEGDVGKVISPRREMVITSDSGQVNVHKDRDLPHLAPLHLIRVALDLRRHRRKDSGRPVKVPHACVHRLHLTQEIGGQVGDRLLATEIDCHQLSRRVRQHRDAGFGILVVMCVDSQVATAIFMDPTLCHHKHPRLAMLCVWPMGMPLILPPGWRSAIETQCPGAGT